MKITRIFNDQIPDFTMLGLNKKNVCYYITTPEKKNIYKEKYIISFSFLKKIRMV